MPASPDCASTRAPGPEHDPKGLEGTLKIFSFITMAMTVPQVLEVWRGSAAGVSVASWLAYLGSACLWLVYGIRKRDKTIYLPCLGWIALDAAIVAGVLMRG
jgi:uncharacterized protein with PQ loop repeat